MKKLLSLLLLLLPFFAISQTTLVRWDGANLQANPYLISSNISAGNISGSNVSFFVDNWGSNGNAFNTAEWPTSGTPNYSKYVQVSISANSGYKIDLSQFNFEYQNYDSNGPSKVQVYYSKDSSFPSNGTLLYTGNLSTSNNNFHSVSVPLTGITVLANETVYLRIAAYKRTNSWSGTRIRIKHGYSDNAPASHNSYGPNITGTVTSVCTTSGDPTVYGTNAWNVYGYNVGSMTPTLANYVGYYTQSTLSLNTQDTANNGWDKNYSPSYSAGWVGCTVPNDNFTMIHKRKGFPCGKYQIYMDNWDDETIVYINGVQAFYNSGWSGENPAPTLVGTYALDSNSTIDVITREIGGLANVKVSLTPVNATYNGSTWSSSPDGAAVIVNGTLNMTTNTTVCSCTLNSGANVTVASGVTLIVKENLSVHQNANLTVENNASLVQIDDNAVNSGKITVKRNTTPVSRYDFTYWSSPVAASDWTLNNLSPNTLADKYYSFNPAGAGWVIHYGGNIPMETGIGYIVRAPQSYSTTLPSIYQGQFIGAPNNGQKTATIKTGATLKSNLIGNPYPSAISIEKFYNANKSAIKGTFYFWTHNIAVSSTPNANGIYNYNPASYISYNLTGATGNGDVNNCTTCGNTTSNKHLGNIASGQGFFVEGKVNNANVVFNNSMRVATASANSQFLRSANSESDNATQSTEDATEETVIEKHRLWLNITNAAGAYNETLLGYVAGATNELDDDYDGITYASGTAIYSLLNDNKLVIQGKALPFSNTDVIPLGFMAAAAGEYSIGLESFDGLFEDQKVYLVDKLTSTVHNIKNDRYTFSTTAAGTFNTRFELRFVNESLGVDTPVVDANDIVVYKNGNQIAIRANNFTIEDVQVFDLTGKEIYNQKEINNSEFSTSGLNVATQVVVVKITLDNNQTISKKVIMN